MDDAVRPRIVERAAVREQVYRSRASRRSLLKNPVVPFEQERNIGFALSAGGIVVDDGERTDQPLPARAAATSMIMSSWPTTT